MDDNIWAIMETVAESERAMTFNEAGHDFDSQSSLSNVLQN